MLKALREYKSSNLLKQFIFLISTILIIIFISFVITNIIAINIIRNNAFRSSEKIVLQVEESINTFHSDMKHISEALIYNPTIKEYITNKNTLDRILDSKDVASVFTNIYKLKENIKGIALYDDQKYCLQKTGKNYLDNYEVNSITSIKYTGVLNENIDKTLKYYSILIPIYDLSISSDQKSIGTCVITMDNLNFNKMLKNSLLTKSSMMLLLDQNNHIIAGEGVLDRDNFNMSSVINNPEYYVKTVTMSDTSWKIISIISKNELYQEMDMVQSFYVTTYIIIVGILFVFLLIFFFGILKPVNELISFMQSYPRKHRNIRMKKLYNNEIGRLGQTLNEMLDDIDILSREIQESQKRLYEIEISKKQMEISSYRNQINPHFLYNTFECIRAMAFYYKADNIAAITEALSKLFRYSVKGDNYSTVGEEISNIREYAKIIEFRFMGRIHITIEVEESIANEKILKVILQPVVENAVFHGLEKKVEDGQIRIEARRTQDNKIQFIIEDNGIGMQETELKELLSFLKQHDGIELVHEATRGVGVLNIYKRLRLFYKDEAEFNIWSMPCIGTKVTIRVPLFDNLSGGVSDV